MGLTNLPGEIDPLTLSQRKIYVYVIEKYNKDIKFRHLLYGDFYELFLWFNG